ncbi:MAG: SUMF1/EgtB/PvdO family nonheme iron enzyme [Labilithrix sp.]|nr:SUMF1/EgtB/PvdO family nonheme iron enzyme [Labilithrix sp.]
MKRAQLGSILFVGGTLLFLVAPSGERVAAGAPEAPRDAAPALPAPAPAEVAAATAVPANAGLKGVATPDLATTGGCAEGMVEVEGDYCPAVEQKCIRWMDPETTIPRRCSEFAPTGKCQTKTVKKHFCIDRYEYPNKAGEKPVVMKTWYEAGDACKAQGKRLCGDSEWTLACEGQERLPYPYGHERNSEACNIDKPHPAVNEAAMANPLTRDAEVARLWQGEVSGSRESCVSPYGAFDMTGNVDEWVVNESGMPYKSGLKGGYWGPVRDRCRPMTTAHYELFAFYQIGFRCCADAPAAGTSPSGSGAAAPGKSPVENTAPSSLTGS